LPFHPPGSLLSAWFRWDHRSYLRKSFLCSCARSR
jgi:hypothetical protein